MEIITYHKSDRQAHWLNEIGKSDWDAAVHLHKMLNTDTFFETVGEGSEVFLLTDGEHLVSFCTYAKRDEVITDTLTPWIGFVFTFPAYRGHHYAGLLFDAIETLAKTQHVAQIYIATSHEGLYEKYGYTYLRQMENIFGRYSRVYIKRIG